MGLGAVLAPGLHRRDQATPEVQAMDSARFDSLTRSLADARSRRSALSGLLAGALSLLGVQSDEVAAHNPLKACKKKSGDAKKKCLKKAKKHAAQHASETTASPPPPPPPDPCASCTGDQVCTGGQCVVPACGAGGPCLVFLSSILYQGNLGGLSGADAKCQSMAKAAALPGTYRAWLSDTTSSPASRFVRSTGPYRLVNGTTIAGEWGGLTDGVLRAPIDVTETGGGIGSTARVWAHTKSNGASYDNALTSCHNWSSTADSGVGGHIGNATKTDAYWTEWGWNWPCDERYHLFCFQQR